MGYTQFKDFKQGMDRTRKSRVIAPIGSCWTIKNAHLTRGGDIERMKKFVKQTGNGFPDTTSGLYSINDTLYTFGYDASEASNVPSGVTHILTQHPTPATAITKVLDAEPYDGQLYSITQFSDGNIYHFYNTTRVTDWDTLATSIGSNSNIAAAFENALDNSAYVSASVASNVITITSLVAGTSFTISTSTVNNGSNPDQTLNAVETQANVVAVSEVLASADITITGGTSSAGVNKIDSITIDGVDILGAAVDWVTSNSATAAALKTQMDTYTSSPEYDITVDNATLTVTAKAGTGATPNGFVVVVNEAGDVTTTHDSTMSGGVTSISAVAQEYEVTVGGTFEPDDQFTIIINSIETYTVTGSSSGTGTTVLTFKKKLYSTASSSLYFCALNAPTQWISGTDYGFINMSSETAGQQSLTAAAEYQGRMAIFSANNIRIWSISEDSSENVFIENLQNTGTIAPNSVLPYGNNDVFYLDSTGIRSIRARDSSNSAYKSDVGTKIDDHIVSYLSTLTDAEKEVAVGVIDPQDGRYMIAIGSRIYVFSYFPDTKVSGWSYYELDITISHFARINNRIYARATDSEGNDYLYLYGGTDNNTYADDNEDNVVIELPFLSLKDPASFTDLQGFDIIATNNWLVEVHPDPSRISTKISHGFTVGTTYGEPRFGVNGFGSLFGLTLTCSTGGSATISALALHYNNKSEGG